MNNIKNEKKIEIPPLPIVVIQVMQFNYESSNADAASMARMIEPDKAICSEILRVANSAYYGRSGTVKRLIDAIMLLGLKTMKNLVIYISTKKFRPSSRYPIYSRYLNEYPILSALYARELAARYHDSTVANDAFLSGLLHKIGMSVIAMQHEKDYAQLIQDWETRGGSLREREKDHFGMDHMMLGREAAKEWNLPPELSEMMNVDWMTPSANLTTPLHTITALSSCISGHIVGMPLADNMHDKGELFRNRYGKDGEGIEGFLSDEYVNRIKAHPYYELALNV